MLILVGCKTFKEVPQDYVYPDPNQYTDQFYMDCVKYRDDCGKLRRFKIKIVRDLSVGWDKEDSGYCEWLSSRIFINYDAWMYSTDTEKRILIYHELGHCALNRWLHTDGMISSLNYDRPKSLMNGAGRLPTEIEFVTYREYYLNELFN